ncbi:MAG: response regulator [Chloroflexi bacterium]|nr:response regulator [Chloroflexota bacterium]
MQRRPARGAKRILVVDDEPTIRAVVAEALSEAGYAVDTAPDGAQALRLIHDRRPHALILDLMMPMLDGAGLRALMRLNADHDEIPIIVLSAAYGAEEGAAQLGASACITKPFDLQELLEAVYKVVGEPLAVRSATPDGKYESPPRGVGAQILSEGPRGEAL